MRNLNFNGESGSEPYTPTAQTSGGPASEGVYSPEFRGDFGAGLLDLHAMDDTELLSEEETDSWLENAANGLMGSQIVKGKEQIKFVVAVFLGLKFSISGTLFKLGSNSYDVTMDDAAIIGGGFGYPLELESKFELELLYTDGKIRITRGYNKILFVHIRTDGLKQKQ